MTSSDGKEIQMSDNIEALDDILLHFGKKGMKWGVRKSESSGGSRKGLLVNKKKPERSNGGDSRKGLLVTKTKPERSNAGDSRKGLLVTKTKPKLEGKPGTVSRKGLLVTKTKKKKISNQEYHNKRKGKVMSYYNADYEQNRRGGLGHDKAMAYARVTSKVSKAITLTPAAIGIAGLTAQAGWKAYDVATSPGVVRAGKNVVLAAKRSKIRVVDGKTMNNVIQATLQNRISQWGDNLDDVLKHLGIKQSFNNRAFHKGAYLDDNMLHAGVKGMKWGVRKSVDNFNNDPKVQVIKAYVKESSKSRVRERAWSKVDTRNLSTDQIYQLAARAQLENDFKRLGKAQGIGGRAYRNRDQLSTEELSSQVNNLRAKEAFKRQAREANREQRERAKAIVTVAGPIAVRFALTRTVSIKDVARQIDKLPKKEYKPMEANTVLGESLLGLTKSTSGAIRDRNLMND